MATGSAAQTQIPTLQVRRLIKAPRERVYKAWTTPEELKRWHAPGPLHVSLAELDVRVGGKYSIHMTQPDGKVHKVGGVYRVVDPPNKLVYSWAWEGDEKNVKDSTVTIEFIEKGNATEVVLTHAIADDKERASHTEGWNGIMEKLDATYPGAKS